MNQINIGNTLPDPPKPLALYESVGDAGGLLYTCGTTARDPAYKGSLGMEMDLAKGKEAAAKAALNLLSILNHHLGDLSLIEKVIKLNVYIAAEKSWLGHSELANGASETLHKYLGERGTHARTTIGVSCLPGGTCVEIEAVVKVFQKEDTKKGVKL